MDYELVLRRPIETAPFIGTYPVHVEVEDRFRIRRHSARLVANLRNDREAPRLPLWGFPLQLVAQSLLTRRIFGRKDLGKEVTCFVYLLDLNFSTPVERGALDILYPNFIHN